MELLKASDLAKQVVGRLMRRDPTQRPRARDVLKHPWLRQATTKDKNSKALITRQDSLPRISVVTTDETDFEDEEDVVSGPIVVNRNAVGRIIETQQEQHQHSRTKNSSNTTTALVSPGKYRGNTSARDLAVTVRGVRVFVSHLLE